MDENQAAAAGATPAHAAEWLIEQIKENLDVPEEVSWWLAARPGLAFQLMLVNEIHDLGTQIELLVVALNTPIRPGTSIGDLLRGEGEQD